MFVVLAQGGVERFTFALRERVEVRHRAQLLDEGAVSGRLVDEAVPSVGDEGVPAPGGLDVPCALARPHRVVLVQHGGEVLAALGVEVRVAHQVTEHANPWPVAFGVLGMEVVGRPVRIPAGAKLRMTLVRPGAVEPVADRLETPARVGEPAPQTPGGGAHRFEERRRFARGERRGEAACVVGKFMAPLDRRLERRGVARVSGEPTPEGVGRAQRLGRVPPGLLAGGLELVLHQACGDAGLRLAPCRFAHPPGAVRVMRIDDGGDAALERQGEPGGVE